MRQAFWDSYIGHVRKKPLKPTDLLNYRGSGASSLPLGSITDTEGAGGKSGEES